MPADARHAHHDSHGERRIAGDVARGEDRVEVKARQRFDRGLPQSPGIRRTLRVLDHSAIVGGQRRPRIRELRISARAFARER